MATRALALRIAALALRVGVGGLFVFAGAVKAWDAQQFALDVQNYQLVPLDAAIVIAVYLPWVEILAGLALMVRRLQLGAITLLTGAMVVFIAPIITAWMRGLDISCGCFGRETMVTNFPALLARDAAILLALLLLGWIEVRAARFDNTRGGVKEIPPP